MKKIFNKRGNLNYKERKLISNIENELRKRHGDEYLSTLDNYGGTANNFSELQGLYDRITTDDAQEVEYEVIEDKKPTQQPTNTNNQTKTQDMPTQKEVSESAFVDPFNREEPLVRDYVMNNEYKQPETSQQGATTTTEKVDFAEPISFEEAFEIPDDNTKKAGNSNNKFSNMGGKGQPQKPQPQKPLNNDFDSMGGDRKRKSSKRFAKYIVELVCSVSEKGFVLFASRSITDAKLAEYEISEGLDMSLLLTVTETQQMTLREFFISQRIQAEQLSKFDKEEKEDLAEALTEVLLEKGAAPTPTQQLMIVALTSFGKRAFMAWSIDNSIQSLIKQLKQQPTVQTQQAPPPPQPTPQPEPQPTQAPTRKPLVEEVELLTAEDIFEGKKTLE